jgi:hypothetical protein
MNKHAKHAVLAVVTLTEKSILPTGSGNLLSCAGPQPSPLMPDTQIWPPTVLCRPRTSSISVWPRPSLRASSGLGLLAAMQWSGVTSLLFP